MVGVVAVRVAALGYRSLAPLVISRHLHRTASHRTATVHAQRPCSLSVGGLRGPPSEAPNGQATRQVARRSAGMRRRGVQQVGAAAAAAASIRIASILQ